jgi:hypothetical protein
LVKIKQRFSTAFYSKTDEAIKRIKIQQIKAGNKKSKPAQAAEDFAKKLRTRQKIAQAVIAAV